VSSRRAQLSLLTLILAALIGVALLAVPASPFYQKPVLGLDLQGGLELTLEAVPPPGKELTEEDLDRSEEKIRQRIDELGVSEPEVRQQGENQISVALAGVFDQERARRIIGRTGELELFKLQDDLTGPSIDANKNPQAHESLFALLRDAQQFARQGKPSAHYLFNAKKKLVAGPLPTRKALLASDAAKKVLKKGDLPACPDLLLPVHVQARRGRAGPGDDRKGHRHRRRSAGLRPADVRAHRVDGLHERGRGQVPRHHT
jgi:preprotein translocase subunit SecD